MGTPDIDGTTREARSTDRKATREPVKVVQVKRRQSGAGQTTAPTNKGTLYQMKETKQREILKQTLLPRMYILYNYIHFVIVDVRPRQQGEAKSANGKLREIRRWIHNKSIVSHKPPKSI